MDQMSQQTINNLLTGAANVAQQNSSDLSKMESKPNTNAQSEPVFKERDIKKENKQLIFEDGQGANTILTQQDNFSKANLVDFGSNTGSKESTYSNLSIVMDVPLDVIVQIGKAQKQVKDIIKLTQGSIIELDKQAGDPVDIFVNGELIARGDVVVIDDNFGVRITEIIK